MEDQEPQTLTEKHFTEIIHQRNKLNQIGYFPYFDVNFQSFSLENRGGVRFKKTGVGIEILLEILRFKPSRKRSFKKISQSSRLYLRLC